MPFRLVASIEYRDSAKRGPVWRVRYRQAGRNRATTFDTEEKAERWCDLANRNLAQALAALELEEGEPLPLTVEDVVAATSTR